MFFSGKCMKIFQFCCWGFQSFSHWTIPSIFQCALLYTTVYGQRRIRVTTLALPCTSMLSNLFRSADLDTQFACMLKQGMYIFLSCVFIFSDTF